MRGARVTLSLPLNTELAVHNPVPADHHMTLVGEPRAAGQPVHFIKDYVGIDYHNDGHTHIDALCHVAYKGSMYNGRPEDAVGEQGARSTRSRCSATGCRARGAARHSASCAGSLGSSPASTCSREDLEAAERAQGVQVRDGRHPARANGPSAAAGRARSVEHAGGQGRAAPDGDAVRVRARVAVLGSDGNNDTAPSSTEGVGFPIHVLAICAMGVHLLDYLQFEDLRETCVTSAGAGSFCSPRRRCGSWWHRLAAEPGGRVLAGAGGYASEDGAAEAGAIRCRAPPAATAGSSSQSISAASPAVEDVGASGLGEAVPAPVDDRLDLVAGSGHQAGVHAEPRHVRELTVDLVVVLPDLGDRRAPADHRHDPLVAVLERPFSACPRTRPRCCPPPRCRFAARPSRAVATSSRRRPRCWRRRRPCTRPRCRRASDRARRRPVRPVPGRGRSWRRAGPP